MSEEVSEYEQLRAENIRRNERMLASLGLSRPTASRAPRRGRKRQKPESPAAAEPVRRSSRRKGLPAPNYAADPFQALDSAESKLASRARRPKRPAPPRARAKAVEGAAYVPPRAASDRSRDTDIDVARLLERRLGREMPVTGKAVAMELAAGDMSPRFNKYSGVAEWKNAIFLWVNIGGVDYENQFLQGGKQITWYGGSRMHPESNVIRRLLKESRRGDQATAPCPLVLFCRLPAEPYVCCGRLAYVEHDESKMPLRFVWKLLDADALVSAEDAPFKALLEA